MADKHSKDIEDVVEAFNGFRRKNTIPLSDYAPEVAEEWLYSKNCGWGPEHFSHASTVIAWWQCPQCNREYKSKIANRVMVGAGCPYCASKLTCEDNSLATHYPAVSKDWHPTKNGKLTPSTVTHQSNKKVWWQCFRGHEWQAVVSDRTFNGSCCPHCQDVRREERRQRPRIRLNRSPDLSQVPRTPAKVAWMRRRESFVPLTKTNPELRKEWHPTKNGDWKPGDFSAGSEMLAWWICKKGPDHVWQARIYQRALDGQGCSMCASKSVSVTNSLQSLFPNLAKQWHKTKNGNLKPRDITAGSSKKVWWQCHRVPSHVWQTSPNARAYYGTGCPECR